MNFKIPALYILILLLCTSCYDAPSYSNIPHIRLKEVNASRPVPISGDSVIVVIEFQDGDGDLGRRNAADTIPNLFIVDKRFGIVDSQSFSIPYIPPKGSVKDVSGEISLNLLSKIYCNPFTPGLLMDTLEFEFQVRDRAGNFSNKISTGQIAIQCH